MKQNVETIILNTIIFSFNFLVVRVRIVFSLKNKGAFLPFHHQHLLSQLIRNLIQMEDNEYKNYIFYNFSGMKGQTKVSKNGLHFYSAKVTLVISSLNKVFLDYLVKQIFQQKLIEIGNLLLEPESIEEEIKPSLSEDVKYVCISPMILVSPLQDFQQAKKFIAPDADIFSDLLYENTMIRMERSGVFSSEKIASFFKFQVIPDRDYLHKIKLDEKKFARIYTILDHTIEYEVRGYTFPFTLYAAPEVQDFIFECGLGAFANKGFGMVDLANQNPIYRTTLYQQSERSSMSA